MVPEWTLGDRLRKIRRETGMTMAEFGAAVGLSQASIGALETDRMRSGDPVALAKRVQMLTGVPASWTLGLHDEAGPGPDGPGPAEEVHPPGLEPGTCWLLPGDTVTALPAREVPLRLAA